MRSFEVFGQALECILLATKASYYEDLSYDARINQAVDSMAEMI